MRLCIDATNIRSGGGIIYLKELLRAAEPQEFGIKKISVWSCEETLSQLPERKWLRSMHEPALNAGQIRRGIWRLFKLTNNLKINKCDALFIPGGHYIGPFRPFITISQNLLPFERGERQRYGISLMRLRLEIIRYAQKSTFRSANGLIFSSNFARKIIEPQVGPFNQPVLVVPSGVDTRFAKNPRKIIEGEVFTHKRPFSWLYVSTVDVYKHQWKVVEATAALKMKGYPLVLNLIGGGYGRALRRLNKALVKWDPDGNFIKYHGIVPHEDLIDYYHSADGVIFASNCDNISFVIMESMAAGLPIVCSNRSAMSEVLGDNGVYFNPEDAMSIANAMTSIQKFPDKRISAAKNAHSRSVQFSWQKCAQLTMKFIADVWKKDR